jgi:hypothetical protein
MLGPRQPGGIPLGPQVSRSRPGSNELQAADELNGFSRALSSSRSDSGSRRQRRVNLEGLHAGGRVDERDVEKVGTADRAVVPLKRIKRGDALTTQ